MQRPIRVRLSRLFWLLFCVICTIVGSAWLWTSAVLSTGYYRQLTASNRTVASAPHPDIAKYVAQTQRKAIEGLSDNLSGLTYSDRTKTLFTVINRKPAVAEISLEGELIRRIPLVGTTDPEGITHVSGDLFIIVDEGDQSVHWVEIGPSTTEVELRESRRFHLDLHAFPNLGIEGASWDAKNRRLYLAQEAFPLRILTLDGLMEWMNGARARPVLKEYDSGDLSKPMLLDLSSVSFHEPSGTLLALSHASSMLINYLPDGMAVGMLALRRGSHGLGETVPQAEGVALDPSGNIYIVSEPNFFYRFGKKSAASEGT